MRYGGDFSENRMGDSSVKVKRPGSVKRFCRKGNTLALIYLAWRTLILFVIGALIGWYANGSKGAGAQQ